MPLSFQLWPHLKENKSSIHLCSESVRRLLKRLLEIMISFSSKVARNHQRALSFSEEPMNTCLMKFKGTYYVNLDHSMIQFALQRGLSNLEKSLPEEEQLIWL